MLHLHQSELILEIMNQCCVWGQIKDTSSLVFQANVILIGFSPTKRFQINITCNVGIYIFSKWRLELCKVRCGLWTKKMARGFATISQHSSLAAIHIEVVYIVSVCMFRQYTLCHSFFSYSLLLAQSSFLSSQLYHT